MGPRSVPNLSEKNFCRSYIAFASEGTANKQQAPPAAALTASPIRQLAWDDNLWSILKRLHGSVWLTVLPFGIANCLLTVAVFILKKWGFDFSSDVAGQKYMATLVSFLIVSRVKITHDNYMEQSGHLSNAYRACREIAQHAVTFSAPDDSVTARQWRQDVCYSVLQLLRMSMGVLKLRSRQQPCTLSDLLQISQEQQEELFLASNGVDKAIRTGPLLRQQPRTSMELSFRAIPILAYNLRRDILKQRNGNWLQPKLLENVFVLRLLDQVGDYLKAWSGLEKFISTVRVSLSMPFCSLQG
jgi:hypothetical protein